MKKKTAKTSMERTAKAVCEKLVGHNIDYVNGQYVCLGCCMTFAEIRGEQPAIKKSASAIEPIFTPDKARDEKLEELNEQVKKYYDSLTTPE